MIMGQQSTTSNGHQPVGNIFLDQTPQHVQSSKSNQQQIQNSASSHGKRVSGSTNKQQFNQTIVGVTSSLNNQGASNIYTMMYQQ